MKQSPNPDAQAPGGDPWAAFGYIVAGVAFYGGIGWGLSVWLHADYWIPIGILVGLALGLFLVFTRYRIGGTEAGMREDHKTPHPASDSEADGTHPNTPRS